MTSDFVRIIAIIVAAIILATLIYYYYINIASTKAKNEHFTSYDESTLPRTSSNKGNAISSSKYQEPYAFEPSDNDTLLPPPPTTNSSSYYKSNNRKCPFPQDRISPEDLLPKDAANTKWAQTNPAGQGDVKDINLLNAGFHIGVDTQGESLRNASHDLRSEPSNPRYKVSIWNNATIESDLNRRPLE